MSNSLTFPSFSRRVATPSCLNSSLGISTSTATLSYTHAASFGDLFYELLPKILLSFLKQEHKILFSVYTSFRHEQYKYKKKRWWYTNAAWQSIQLLTRITRQPRPKHTADRAAHKKTGSEKQHICETHDVCTSPHDRHRRKGQRCAGHSLAISELTDDTYRTPKSTSQNVT